MTAGKFFTPLEAEEAISKLDDASIIRLKEFADINELVWNDLEMSAEELISEAVALTIEGIRQWNTKLTIEFHLIGVMRSLASDQRRTSRAENETCETDYCDSDVISSIYVDSNLSEQIHHLNMLERIVEHFQEEEVCTYVLEGLVEGMPSKEVIAKKNLSINQYDAARKKISRWLFKLKNRGDVL